MFPWRHLSSGFARWLTQVSSLGEPAVLWEQAESGLGVSGPSLRLSRIGLRTDGHPAARMADCAETWTLDFAAFSPGNPVVVFFNRVPIVASTAALDTPAQARDKWIAAFNDLWLGELAVATPLGAAGATLSLAPAAPRGPRWVLGGQGVSVTPGSLLGAREWLEIGAVWRVRVTAWQFPSIWEAESELGRISSAVGSMEWIELSRLYLCGAGGQAVSSGIVISPQTTPSDTRAYVDMDVALVGRTSGAPAAQALADFSLSPELVS